MQNKHWSQVEYLHETHRNPNIHIKGTSSYYSNAWTGNFNSTRYASLYGCLCCIDRLSGVSYRINKVSVGVSPNSRL